MLRGGSSQVLGGDEKRRGLDRLRGLAGPLPVYRTLELHEFHEVGADRRPVRHRSRRVVAAPAGSMTRHLYVYDAQADTAPDEVVVSGVRSCQVGRTWIDHPSGLVAVELILEPPLAAGGPHTFEYETTFHYRAPPPPELRRGVPGEGCHLRVQLRFDRAALPGRILRCWWASFDDDPVDVDQLQLDRDHCVGFDEDSPEPGTFAGIRWEW